MWHFKKLVRRFFGMNILTIFSALYPWSVPGLVKKWSMLGVRLLSYGCTREVGRAREKRLSGTRRSRVLL